MVMVRVTMRFSLIQLEHRVSGKSIRWILNIVSQSCTMSSESHRCNFSLTVSVVRYRSTRWRRCNWSAIVNCLWCRSARSSWWNRNNWSHWCQRSNRTSRFPWISRSYRRYRRYRLTWRIRPEWTSGTSRLDRSVYFIVLCYLHRVHGVKRNNMKEEHDVND